MPEPAYFLDQNDRDTLEAMFRWWRAEKGQPRRQRTPPAPVSDSYAGPRVYVALTPPTGLPALNRYGTTGTGTADAQDDTPGEAECDIYRIDETPGTAGMARFDRIPDLTKTVFNLSESAVGGAAWIPVWRTESGAWVTGGTGSGGGSSEITLSLTGCSLSIKANGMDVPGSPVDLLACLADQCQAIDVVTGVSCVDDEIAVDTTTINYIVCPS